VFIRSMATRGHLGGIALAAPEAIRVLDASGARLVLVETVGVGQAEVDVATATDTTIVVVAPGWGDAVQVSKAGILEIADLFAVNKAEREGANEALRDLEVMIRMGPRTEWTPPVIRTSTIDGSGIEELFDAISAHRAHQEESGGLEQRRRARQLHEVERMAAEAFRERIATGAGDAQLARDLQERRIDPYAAAAILVERAGAVDAPSA
jgi:LAO/AO transport system kinase